MVSGKNCTCSNSEAKLRIAIEHSIPSQIEEQWQYYK